MNRATHVWCAACLFGLTLSTSSALDITIDKGAYATISGGQVTGTGITAQPIGTGAGTITITNLQPNGVYNLDFFHNSGANGSDFFIYVNAAGTGIASNSLSGHGAGQQVMVKDFAPGDTTLMLNVQQVTLNANSAQQGNYWLPGIRNSTGWGQGSGPVTSNALPGLLSWDNLYNSGANNEDFQFLVTDDGTVGPIAGYGEYASFGGSSVYPNAVKVRWRIDASTNLPSIFVAYHRPILSPVATIVTNVSGPLLGRVFHYEFDMLMTPGNTGHLLADFQNTPPSNLFVSSTAMRSTNASIHVVGPSYQGFMGGDIVFAPRLRFTNSPNANTGFSDFYWQNTDGANGIASALIVGFRDGGAPLSVFISMSIPEPTSTALFFAGAAALCVWRRFRSR